MARRWFKRWHNRAIDTERSESVNQNVAQHAGSLCLLPADLIFMICQYLTRMEVIMLMLICARFWNSRTGTGVFARAWHQMKLPVGKDLNKTAVRFYILRILEYDGVLKRGFPKKYCCWGCMRLHERQYFSRKEFKKEVDLKSNENFNPKESARRSCELAKRYIWFGICGEMSLVDFRHAVANPPNGQNLIKFEDNNIYLAHCSWFNIMFRRLEYSITIASAQHMRSYRKFRRHATNVDIPLCSHLKLSHKKVYRLFRTPMKPYTCEYCATTVQIEISLGVCVHVYRYVGMLNSPRDPAWKAQSYEKRHRRLLHRNIEFCGWFHRTYDDGLVARNRALWPFHVRQIAGPFKGFAACKTGWPEHSRPRCIQSDQE